MEGWDGEGGMEEEEEEEEEQRGCGWGWVAWLTGLDLAGWLAVTHNPKTGVLPRVYECTHTHTHTHAHTHTHDLYAHIHIMHHVSMWKQTIM